VYNLPLSKQEILRYLKKPPEKINFFIWHNKKVLNLTHLRLFHNKPEARLAIIKVHKSSVKLRYISPNGSMVIVCDPWSYKELPTNVAVDLIFTYDCDLLFKYNTYYARESDDILKGVSKKKILYELNEIYNNIDKSDPSSLISLYFYLEINARMMGIKTGGRKFVYDYNPIANNYNPDHASSDIIIKAKMILLEVIERSKSIYCQLCQEIDKLK
jgi:hypothetical protein